MRIEIINGSMYVTSHTANKGSFIPICEVCKKRNVCDEPSKEQRLTCPIAE